MGDSALQILGRTSIFEILLVRNMSCIIFRDVTSVLLIIIIIIIIQLLVFACEIKTNLGVCKLIQEYAQPFFEHETFIAIFAIPIKSQLTTLHTFAPNFIDIHFNIILKLRFATKNFTRLSIIPCVLRVSPISFSFIYSS